MKYVPCLPPAYQPALALELALGDPARPDNTLSSRSAMRLDESETFPEAAMALLHRVGMPLAYVPKELGGSFESCETFLALARCIARRDMNVAVSHSTLLWSTLAWIGGNERQRQAVADWMIECGEFPCLAYSEAEHGADLAANELTATRLEDGSYLLNGEKWPINRATRSGFVLLLARTNDAEGARSQSLFIVDKRKLPEGRCYDLPRVRTHGLRGCDVSGIGFRNCPLPASACVGAPGHGIELALKGFQVTRSFCTALSMGVGDSALRLVADFAAERRLYRTTVDQLPHARDVLANAYLSQLMAECVCVVAARGLHLHPGQFSAWSSVAKVQVTQLVDEAMHELSAVLGARHYMREAHGEGMFQKLLRDGAIVSVFDGSTMVCLDALATALPSLARGRQRSAGMTPEAVKALFDLAERLPGFSYQRLDLSCRGRDAVLESLPLLLDLLDSARADGVCSTESLAALRDAAAGVFDRLQALDEEALTDGTPGQRNSARRMRLAQRYLALHTEVAALGLWLHNRFTLGDFFASGLWLLAILGRHGMARFEWGALDPAWTDALHAELDRQRRERQMFSLFSWPLAKAGAAESVHPVFGELSDDECTIV